MDSIFGFSDAFCAIGSGFSLRFLDVISFCFSTMEKKENMEEIHYVISWWVKVGLKRWRLIGEVIITGFFYFYRIVFY